jgi:hypothetical protein
MKYNYFNERNDSQYIAERYNIVLPPILNSPAIHIFSALSDIKVADFIFKIRKSAHPDLLDCIIASTTYALDGILITEDGTLQKRLEKEITPKLKIYTLNRFLKLIKNKE